VESTPPWDPRKKYAVGNRVKQGNKTSVITHLKRKHTNMYTENLRREHIPAQNYQPYRSVIQKMIKHPDHQISSKHNVADFKEAVPKPWNYFEGYLSQSYAKNQSDAANSSGDGSVGDDVENISKDEIKENIESKDKRNPYSANEMSLYPLKKRQRMMEIPYDTEHGIDKKVLLWPSHLRRSSV
jgi:hypothetical protein